MNSCRQFGQLVKKHWLEWWRRRLGCYLMLTWPLILVLVSFGPFRLQTALPVQYSFEGLRHAIYPIAKLNERRGTWGMGLMEREKQQDDMQEFMWYNDYHNMAYSNKTWEQPSDREEDEQRAAQLKMQEDTRTEPGIYHQDLDLFGPSNFFPLHCYTTNSTTKYESPIIGYIDNGNQITKDIIVQLDSIFKDQAYILQSIADVDEILKQWNDIFDPLKLLGITGVAENKLAQNEESVPYEETEEVKITTQLGLDQASNRKIMQFLSGAVHPQEAGRYNLDDILDRLGNFFVFKAFADKEAIDAYVSQPGYGRNDDKPGLCFALGVQQNTIGNKYELELFFNDQWPEVQAGIPLQQMDAAPSSDDVEVDYYMKYQYNGFSYLQHFVANTILQRKTTPDAIIVNMIMPQELKPYVFNQQAKLVTRVLQIYFVLILLPLIIVMSHQVLYEKESGLKSQVLASGVNPFLYWASWWVIFLAMSCLTGCFLGFGFWWAVFYDASLLLIVSFFSLVCLSALSLVWALLPLCMSEKWSELIILPVFFYLCASHALIDQTHLSVPADQKRSASYSAMVAAKETLLLMTQFSSNSFGLNFDNYGEVRANYSVKLGFEMLAIDASIYFAIGCVLEAIVLLVQRFAFDKRHEQSLAKRQSDAVVKDEHNEAALGPKNEQQSAIILQSYESENQKNNSGLQLIDVRFSPNQPNSINHFIKSGQVCCLTGTNNELEQRERFLRVLRKQDPIEHGKIILKGVDMKEMAWKHHNHGEVKVLPLLTAGENLDFYIGLQTPWLNSSEISKSLQNHFPVDEPMNKLSFSKVQLLKNVIEICTGDRNLLVLQEPTLGLDQTQKRTIYQLINKLKQHRVIIVDTQDEQLIEVLADQVVTLSDTFQLTTDSNDQNSLARLNQNHSVSVVIKTESPESTVAELSDIVQVAQLKALSQSAGTVTLEFTAPSKLAIDRVIDVLKQKKLNFAILTKSAPRMAPDLDHFKIVFELCGDVSNSVDLMLEAKMMLAADSCKILQTTELGTKLLELRFKSEETFTDIVENKKLYGEKLNGVLVEVYTPYLNLPSKATRKSRAGSMEYAKVDVEEPSHEFDLNRKRRGGINVSLLEDIEEEIEQNEKLEQMKAQRPTGKIRLCKLLGRECCLQGKLGFWQMLCQVIAPCIILLYFTDCVSTVYNSRSESRRLGADWLPPKQEIFINKKVKYGNVDPIDLMASLDDVQSGNFWIREVETQWNNKIAPFKQMIYDDTISDSGDYSQFGSFEFFELNSTSNKYMFTTLVDITSPHASILFPQFALDAILKVATRDPEFEFRTRSTPFAIQDNLKKDNFPQAQQLQIKTQNNQVMMLQSWTDIGLRISAIFAFCYVILASSIVAQLVSDRVNHAKVDRIQHGLPRCFYWLTRLFWDLIKFLPFCYLMKTFAETDEPQMEVMIDAVKIFPFAALPFLYVVQHIFSSPVAAASSVALFELTSMVMLPFFISKLRTGQGLMDRADNLAGFCRTLPSCAFGQTIMFNSEWVGWLSDVFFPWPAPETSPASVEEVELDPEAEEPPPKPTFEQLVSSYPSNPWDFQNAGGDYYALIISIFAWWVILILVADRRGTRHGICCYRQITYKLLKRHESIIKKISVSRFQAEQLQPAEIKSYALLAENVGVAEPHESAVFCVVCKHGDSLVERKTFGVKIGEVLAIVGAAGTGKTTLLQKLADKYTPMQHQGRIMRLKQSVMAAQSDEKAFASRQPTTIVSEYLEQLSVLGNVRLDFANEILKRLGYMGILPVQLSALLPKQAQALKLAVALASRQDLLFLDEPLTGLDSAQKETACTIIADQHNKAVILTLNSRQDLDLVAPTQNYCLDDLVIAYQPYLRLTFCLKPLLKDEVHDFIENFFEPLKDELQNCEQKLLPKELLVVTIIESSMAQASKEQLLDYLKGVPEEVDLQQEACEFLQIFKAYKVVRLLADTYGEIFIDWQIQGTVQVSFADAELLQPLKLVKFLRLESSQLIQETVKSFKVSAQLDVPEPNKEEKESFEGGRSVDIQVTSNSMLGVSGQ